MKTKLTLSMARRFVAQLKNGAYAWPGGYPVYYITTDGLAICPACAEANKNEIIRAIVNRDDNGWCATGYDVNWEDDHLYCDHCSKRIESAYGDV